MFLARKFVQVVDEIEALSRESVEKQKILETIAQRYELTHVAYLGIHLPAKKTADPLVCVTYPDEWVARYREKDYVRIDPVIHRSLQSILPTDWSEFPQHAKIIRQLFGEAREFGVGSNGISFPIRGRLGETAMFSIVSDLSKNEWDDFRKVNLPELQMLAFYVHRIISGFHQSKDETPQLSPREIECLKWCSAGKTADDIGVILNLSAKTVRVYLETARHKLNGLNITHAVVRALALEIIPPPS